MRRRKDVEMKKIIEQLKKRIKQAISDSDFIGIIQEMSSHAKEGLDGEYKERFLEVIDQLVKKFNEKYIPEIESFNREEFENFWESVYWAHLDKPFRWLLSGYHHYTGEDMTKEFYNTAQKKVIAAVTEDIASNNYSSPADLVKRLNNAFVYTDNAKTEGAEEIIKTVDNLLLEFIKNRKAENGLEYLRVTFSIREPELKEKAAELYCDYIKETYEGKLGINNDEQIALTSKFAALGEYLDSELTRKNDAIWKKIQNFVDDIWGKYVVDTLDLTNDDQINEGYRNLNKIPKHQFAFLMKVNAANPEKALELFSQRNGNGSFHPMLGNIFGDMSGFSIITMDGGIE